MQTSINEVAQTTVAADGSAALTFQPVQQGMTWTGSISIPGTQPNSTIPVLWTAYDNNSPIGTWYNDQASGTLQAKGVVTVKAKGIIAALLLVAYFGGISTSADATPPSWPSATPAPPPSQPFTLYSGAAAAGVGSASTLVPFAPVQIGTSVSLSAAVVGSATRIALIWTNDPTSNLFTADYSFDIGGGQGVAALVLPNLGPWLQVQAISAGTNTLTAIVETGLPPITRSPTVATGVLWNLDVTVPAATTQTFLVPPYVGPVSVWTEPNSISGVGVEMLGVDYLGNVKWRGRILGDPTGTAVFDAQNVAYLPSLINKVELINSSGSPVEIRTSGVALGP